MKAGERRVVTFLCSVPRDAIVGRTRVAASAVEGAVAEHVEVQPPRPQAKAPHRNGAPKIDGDLADWQGVEPVAVDGGKHVRLDGWKGKADCSAKVWAGWDERWTSEVPGSLASPPVPPRPWRAPRGARRPKPDR